MVIGMSVSYEVSVRLEAFFGGAGSINGKHAKLAGPILKAQGKMGLESPPGIFLPERQYTKVY